MVEQAQRARRPTVCLAHWNCIGTEYIEPHSNPHMQTAFRIICSITLRPNSSARGTGSDEDCNGVKAGERALI